MKRTATLLVLLLLPWAYASDTWDRSERQEAKEFTFARLIYSGGGWRRGASWSVDFPKADRQFLYVLHKLHDFTFINPRERAIRATDKELLRYPFLYAVEVGHMELSLEEAAALREYLLRGGFLVVDDFHGPWEWRNFYRQMKKVFPEYEPRTLTVDHPIFHCYYSIDRLIQVPGLQYLYSGSLSEKGGVEPHYMGIEDDSGRLMVMINHNVDLGDAWEWAEVDEYPRPFAEMAIKLGTNYIIYAMTH
ncbi:MAG TPA: DUF4159 domain-containing protein [Acidobacteriota bacterium]|nr:DUF4159 domain-containing protein [Acidobacteriota bacterium]